MSKPRSIPLGARNIVGAKVEQVRKQKGMKQKELVAILQAITQSQQIGFSCTIGIIRSGRLVAY